MMEYLESLTRSVTGKWDMLPVDQDVVLAIVIVVCSTVLTLSCNQTVSNDNHQESLVLQESSVEHLSNDDAKDSLPEATETYCGSYGSEASTSERSLADQERLPSSFLPAEDFVVIADAHRGNDGLSKSFKKLITKLKNKKAASKEARMLKISRAAVLKKLQRKSFADRFRSLNPLLKLRNKNLLTKSKSFTVAKSSSLSDDHSCAGKSI